MSPSKKKEKIVGITLGDPAGIGAEVVIKSISRINLPSDTKLLLIGDSCLINSLSYNIDIPFYSTIKEWNKDREKIVLLDKNILDSSHKIKYGKENHKYGEAAYRYLKKAGELLKNKEIDRLITAPVNKKIISSTGVNFKGHTEFLADEFNIEEAVMMLFSDSCRFILLTRHIPIKEVSEKITESKMIRNVKIVEKEIKKVFKLDKVKMGVAGLNPHLGDRGLIGKKEKKMIRPVVEKLAKKHDIVGPLTMERLISKLKEGKIDVAFCHYHDQATVPLKLLHPGRGINLTLGLPFIRTSPFHGTAYDIAGMDKASPDSMIETLKFTTSA